MKMIGEKERGTSVVLHHNTPCFIIYVRKLERVPMIPFQLNHAAFCITIVVVAYA